MLMHHTSESAKSRLNPESYWLVNGSFLLTYSFCKNYLFSVPSLWCTFVNPFLVVDPTHILVHPRVHRAHRLKSAASDAPHYRVHFKSEKIKGFLVHLMVEKIRYSK